MKKSTTEGSIKIPHCTGKLCAHITTASTAEHSSVIGTKVKFLKFFVHQLNNTQYFKHLTSEYIPILKHHKSQE